MDRYPVVAYFLRGGHEMARAIEQRHAEPESEHIAPEDILAVRAERALFALFSTPELLDAQLGTSIDRTLKQRKFLTVRRFLTVLNG